MIISVILYYAFARFSCFVHVVVVVVVVVSLASTQHRGESIDFYVTSRVCVCGVVVPCLV